MKRRFRATRIHFYVPGGRVTIGRGSQDKIYSPSMFSVLRLTRLLNRMANGGRVDFKVGPHGWLAVVIR